MSPEEVALIELSQGGDRAAMQALLARSWKFLGYHTHRWTGPLLTHDDAAQIAALALLEAIAAYDVGCGLCLTTASQYRIQRALSEASLHERFRGVKMWRGAQLREVAEDASKWHHRDILHEPGAPPDQVEHVFFNETMPLLTATLAEMTARRQEAALACDRGSMAALARKHRVSRESVRQMRDRAIVQIKKRNRW